MDSKNNHRPRYAAPARNGRRPVRLARRVRRSTDFRLRVEQLEARYLLAHDPFCLIASTPLPLDCVDKIISHPEVHGTVIDVTQFGAVPNNDHDDSGPMQAAANYLREHPEITRLLYPPGVYNILKTASVDDQFTTDHELHSILYDGISNVDVVGYGATIDVKGDFTKAVEGRVDGIPDWGFANQYAITPFAFFNSSNFTLSGFKVLGHADLMKQDLTIPAEDPDQVTPITYIVEAAEYGVWTVDSHDFVLQDLLVRGMATDGIQIGSGYGDKNVTIRNVVASNNARAGLAIIQARNIEVRDSYFLETGVLGTAPDSYAAKSPARGVVIEADCLGERADWDYVDALNEPRCIRTPDEIEAGLPEFQMSGNVLLERIAAVGSVGGQVAFAHGESTANVTVRDSFLQNPIDAAGDVLLMGIAGGVVENSWIDAQQGSIWLGAAKNASAAAMHDSPIYHEYLDDMAADPWAVARNLYRETRGISTIVRNNEIRGQRSFVRSETAYPFLDISDNEFRGFQPTAFTEDGDPYSTFGFMYVLAGAEFAPPLASWTPDARLLRNTFSIPESVPRNISRDMAFYGLTEAADNQFVLMTDVDVYGDDGKNLHVSPDLFLEGTNWPSATPPPEPRPDNWDWPPVPGAAWPPPFEPACPLDEAPGADTRCPYPADSEPNPNNLFRVQYDHPVSVVNDRFPANGSIVPIYGEARPGDPLDNLAFQPYPVSPEGAFSYPLAETFGARITVNSTADTDVRDGVLTLREAILVSDGMLEVASLTPDEQTLISGTPTTGVRDLIQFDIPGPGPHTIQPTFGLPTISDPVILDGATQPGFAGVPVIELDGSLSGGADGLTITSGLSRIRGLSINRFAAGIVLNSDGNVVAGNYVGTDAYGSAGLGNSDGVVIEEGSYNVIGGWDDRDRNVLSGNSSTGVALGGSNTTQNVILGNYIGTTPAGDEALPNLYGVLLSGAVFDNRIGSPYWPTRNVISGNSNYGIALVTSGSVGSIVEGNLIGLAADASMPLGNGVAGVLINGSSGHRIGGRAYGAGNVISGHADGGTGIWITNSSSENLVQGNWIGTDRLLQYWLDTDALRGHARPNTTGIAVEADAANNTIGFWAGDVPYTDVADTDGGNLIAFSELDGVSVNAADRNTLARNMIFGNSGLGINLFSPADPLGGVTPNDPDDLDGGSNSLLNYPVITAAARSFPRTVIAGTFQSAANAEYRLEVFTSDTCNPSGHGEGERFLGEFLVTTAADGSATFLVDHSWLHDGEQITATATDRLGNTSEFSQCVSVREGFVWVGADPDNPAWDNPGNWLDGQVPGEGEVVILDSLYAVEDLVIPEGQHVSVGALINRATLIVRGELTVASQLLNDGGTLKGTDQIHGQVINQNGGVVSPGESPGVLTINGMYSQATGGSLAIEIGGRAAGSEFDRLRVDGALTLEGVLNVSLIGGFIPQVGDRFLVLDKLSPGPIQGTFQNLPEGGSLLVGATAFHISYRGGDGNDVVLSADSQGIARISGGGSIDNGLRNFGFAVRPAAGGRFKGQLKFQDKLPANSVKLKSTSITAVNVSGIHGSFAGTATKNGVRGFTFTVDVEDNGEPGAGLDKFRIRIFAGPTLVYDSDMYARREGLLDRGGNIQIHVSGGALPGTTAEDGSDRFVADCRPAMLFGQIPVGMQRVSPRYNDSHLGSEQNSRSDKGRKYIEQGDLHKLDLFFATIRGDDLDTYLQEAVQKTPRLRSARHFRPLP